MKVAFIGNSHLAAFRLGWDAVAGDFPGVQSAFFGSPASTMRRLKVSDGCLVPTTEKLRQALLWTSGGLDRIAGDYDRYVVVGMGFSFPHLMAILRTHRTPEYWEGGTEQIISDACLQAAMRATLDDSLALRAVHLVRQISPAPIIYFPNPFHTVDSLRKESFWGLESARERMYAFYREGLARTMEPLATVVEQPAETRADRFFTRAEFSRDAKKLREGMRHAFAADDFAHMNATFGALAIRAVLDAALPAATSEASLVSA